MAKGVEVKHSNVTNCASSRLPLSSPASDDFAVVLLEPGNVGMAPGRRVSQLLNIAFDMAAWVKVYL